MWHVSMKCSSRTVYFLLNVWLPWCQFDRIVLEEHASLFITFIDSAVRDELIVEVT